MKGYTLMDSITYKDVLLLNVTYNLGL